MNQNKIQDTCMYLFGGWFEGEQRLKQHTERFEKTTIGKNQTFQMTRNMFKKEQSKLRKIRFPYVQVMHIAHPLCQPHLVPGPGQTEV